MTTGDRNITYFGSCLNSAMNYTSHVCHFKRSFCMSGTSKFVAQIIIKGGNHNKSGHSVGCIYVKGEEVSYVSKLIYRSDSARFEYWV